MKMLAKISVLFLVIVVEVQGRSTFQRPRPNVQLSFHLTEGCADGRQKGDKWIPDGKCAKCQCKAVTFYDSGLGTECESCESTLPALPGFVVKEHSQCEEYPKCCPEYVHQVLA